MCGHSKQKVSSIYREVWEANCPGWRAGFPSGGAGRAGSEEQAGSGWEWNLDGGPGILKE